MKELNFIRNGNNIELLIFDKNDIRKNKIEKLKEKIIDGYKGDYTLGNSVVFSTSVQYDNHCTLLSKERKQQIMNRLVRDKMTNKQPFYYNDKQQKRYSRR